MVFAKALWQRDWWDSRHIDGGMLFIRGILRVPSIAMASHDSCTAVATISTAFLKFLIPYHSKSLDLMLSILTHIIS